MIIINLADYNNLPMGENYTINIYRSYNRFTEYNLPEPLITVFRGTLSFRDDTVDDDRLVYYMVGLEYRGTTRYSSLYPTSARRNTGLEIKPGFPDFVIRGDSLQGRYGTFDTPPFWTDEIVSAMGGADNGIVPSDKTNGRLEKCIYNNKVLLVPTRPLVRASFRDLYIAGAAYANDLVNTNTPETASHLGEYPQGKARLTKDGYEYVVRVITDSEYNYLYRRLFASALDENNLSSEEYVTVLGNNDFDPGFSAVTGTLDGTYITPQIKSDSRFKGLVEQGRDIVYQGHTYRPFIMDQWMFDNLFTPMNNNKLLRTASNLQVKYDMINKKDAYTAVALSNNKASKYVRQNTTGATILWYDHWLLSNIDICWKLME
ncbi:hypothetical protein RVBP21_2410 [Pseudomonas phage BRkr]|nr:hypothetical protein RVBP21_2410 [Pseudomonas phage BRkr]